MPQRFHDRACERAQAWASLDLDGELSQIERALLRAHLRRCEACAASVGDVVAFTRYLRDAPLEAPSRPLFAPSPRAPVLSGRRMATRLALAATLAVLAAGLGAFAGSLGQGPRAPSPPQDAEIALLPSNDELRDVRGVRAREPLGDERLLPRSRLGGV